MCRRFQITFGMINHKLNLLIIQHVEKTIRAQQKYIARKRRLLLHINLNARFHPQRTRDQTAITGKTCLLGRNQPNSIGSCITI